MPRVAGLAGAVSRYKADIDRLHMRSMSYHVPFTSYPYRGEAVICDLCGGSDIEPICDYDRRFKRLRTVACLGCGFLRTDPMPTDDELLHYYRAVYRWDYQLVSGRPSRRHLNRSRRQAQHRMQPLAPALPPGARVWDFGCGGGVFLGLARDAGHSVVGIEPGDTYARFASEQFGVPVICESWDRIKQPIGPFDVITAVEVLEHLRKPVSALRWLAGLMTDHAVIYVTVPDCRPNSRETFRRFHFAHVHGFTPTTLLWAAQACGLEPDPRFPLQGTQAVFRKAANPLPPAFEADYARSQPALYPADSVGRYLLSGAWIGGRARQLGKTIRDTFRSS